jgi:hypothetical protein
VYPSRYLCTFTRNMVPTSSVSIFHWHNPSGRTMALGSIHPLNRNEYQAYFPAGGGGVKAAGA